MSATRKRVPLVELKRVVPLHVAAHRLGVKVHTSGRRRFIQCPSGTHDDSTPSCQLNENARPRRAPRWYCYACRASGDLFDLVAAVEGVDNGTAIATVRAWAE